MQCFFQAKEAATRLLIGVVIAFPLKCNMANMFYELIDVDLGGIYAKYFALADTELLIGPHRPSAHQQWCRPTYHEG